MSNNSFVYNPVKVIIFDPIKNTSRRAFCFLGDVPKNISAACENYSTAPAQKKSSYDGLLREFYGNDFKAKLGLNITNFSQAWISPAEKSGSGDTQNNVIIDDGVNEINSDSVHDPILAYELSEPDVTYNTPHEDTNEGDNVTVGRSNDEVDDSDIESLLNETLPIKDTKHIAVDNLSSAEDLHVNFEPGIEYITNVHVYPEDKFNEIKDKVYLATGIPTYRQHVFYINRNRAQTVYKIHAEGLYNVDIRELSSRTDFVHGVPIDKYLYDIRTSIHVEALDTFKIVADELSNNIIYVVDLAQFTYKLRTQLMNVINDTYQFELFYYGFVIKYWPQLTQECFYDYVLSEPELQHKYPDLAKSKISLSSIYRIEKEIIGYNYKNMTRALALADSAGITLAITQMIATVSGTHVLLNIRNLFDKLRTTRCIPEIHAYIEYNNKKYLLRKRHIRNGSDIHFPSGVLMKNGVTLAISLRKSDQDSFHSKSAVSTMENEQSRYLFLNIWPNGKYYIRTVWNEEDEFNFDDIIRIMKRFTDPVINGINALGRIVFISGRSLPLITKQNINYQGLNICIFWKKVMLESTFKVVSSLWEPYMHSKIIGPRNVQQLDKYEFLFRKGMYDFDTTAIERIVTASNNIILTNYYSYLSNNTVKQKWEQNYDGRIVKMSHRTTDVRFEVNDIREREFNLFRIYIVLFVYRAINDEKVKHALATVPSYKDVKKLRKLREQDPELYNLKKYGSKKVYSIICQNQRQPLIYTQDELKNLPAAELKKLTQYWNFTLNTPAYYGCPNKKYPHLSFMVNMHPKHYCLPCCNKKSHTDEDSKRTRINSICLRKHKYTETNEETGTSRHIINYGKDIDLGRLSKLPQTSIKNLLFGTLDSGSATVNNNNYYIYGVAQHVPGCEHIGIIYSVAEAMHIPMEDLMKKIITILKKPTSEALFNILLNGSLIEYFNSMDDLTLTIKDLFIDMKLFSKGIQKFKQWSEFFTEIFHILFKISIFTFIDADGEGSSIELFVPDLLKNEIVYISKIAANSTETSELVSTLTSDQIYVLLIKKQNRYYPIFVIDSEKYFKSLEIEMRHYKYTDKITQLFYKMVNYAVDKRESNVEKPQDLILIKEFLLKNPTYKMIKKFVNKQNLCYAVLLDSPAGKIYVPIDYSVHVSDGIDVTFDAFLRINYKLSLTTIKLFMNDFNNFIKTTFTIGAPNNAIYSYKFITPIDYIKFAGDIIGFTNSTGYIFYFTTYTTDEIDPKLPIRVIKYDYTEINKLILKRAPPVEDRRVKLIGEALYNNYLYQLFVIEFVNYLDMERNTNLRNKLKTLIMETNFKKDVSGFRTEIKNLLKEYPTDNSVLRDQLIAFYHTYFDKERLLQQINSTVYDFDRVTMNRLKKLTSDELKKELTKIAENFSIRKDFDPTAIKFPNIYMPCSEINSETGYCDEKKLIINRPVDEFVDILAVDLMDELKSKYLLNNVWTDTIINFLQFIKWPTEIITIYRLTE